MPCATRWPGWVGRSRYGRSGASSASSTSCCPMGVRTVLGTRGKLLIVDDSSTVRRSIERHIFSDRVTEVYQAANGREAMELFERYRPEFVTMDLTMPGMDGLTCISKIMSLKPDTRLMVISALGDAATAIEAV